MPPWYWLPDPVVAQEDWKVIAYNIAQKKFIFSFCFSP